MDYSIDLLRAERNKLNDELLNAKTGHRNDWNWDVIVRNERLLQDLNKAIELLCLGNGC